MNRSSRQAFRGVRAGAGAFLLIVTFAATAAAQGVPTSADKAAIAAKLDEIEGQRDLDESVKAKALELLRLALKHAEAASAYEQEALAFKGLLESAPQEIRSIRQTLASPPRAAELPTTAEGLGVEALQARLREQQTRLANARSELATVEKSLEAEAQRPAAARAEIEKAKQDLEKVEAELQAPLPTDEPAAVVDALRANQAARRQSLLAAVSKLEQELLTYDLRVELLNARRDLLVRESTQAEARSNALEQVVGEARRVAAERARLEAEKAREAAAGKHSVVQTLAEENARLGQEAAETTKRVEEINLRKQSVAGELRALEEEFSAVRARLKVSEPTGMHAELLLDQRKRLRLLGRSRPEVAAHEAELRKASLRRLRIDEDRRRLADLESAVAERMSDVDTEADVPASAGIESEVRELLGAQLSLLDKLYAEYDRYRRALVDLGIGEDQVVDKAEEFADFLDERLLWIPSAPRLGAESLTRLVPALEWICAPENWRSLLQAADDAYQSAPVLATLLIIFGAVLLLVRRLLRSWLASTAERVNKLYGDHFVLTIGALGATLLLAVPAAYFVGLLSWAFRAAPQSSSFAQAVGQSLEATAYGLFGLQAWRFLCRENGVAQAHFRWREQTLRLYRRHLRWFIPLILAAFFVGRVTAWQPREGYYHSLGRIAFIVGLLGISVFAWRVLPPRRGVLTQTMAAKPDGWLNRLRHVWFPMIIGLPVALGVLAATGYYYTAFKLYQRALWTLLLLLGVVLVHQLIVRWFSIARKKLALARARERREASQSVEEEGGEEDVEVVIETPTIDLQTVSRHTFLLVRTVLTIVTLLGLWFIWSDVFPALGVLDRVELWPTTLASGELVKITLADLLLALLILLLTGVAARNLPGAVEVAGLSRLPVEAGVRYAITSIGQYLAVTLGIIFAFQALGVGWSHVQWLVAAVGVGLGFGLQEIFANFVSGLIILLERPVRVGDTVTVGSVSGTVTRIRMRATTIMDWDHKELIVPNKEFITGQLVNWTLSSPVNRLTVRVGIEYGSDTELALKLMLEAARANPKVLEEPESTVFFVGFGESSLDFDLRVFVKETTNRGRSRVVHELHMAIDKAFREHELVIAFPQRDLHIKSDVRSPVGDEPHSSRAAGGGLGGVFAAHAEEDPRSRDP